MAREFQGDMSQAMQGYRIIVRNPIPSNLIEQVSALHAYALLRLRNETFAKPVGDSDYSVTEKANNIENGALVSCSRNAS
jgi:hypothetical protein